MAVEMRIAGLTIDPITNTPIVILKDLTEKKAIPIWIGLFEASAIATELEKISFSRPMTHDLIKDILETLGAHVTKVEINELKNNTYFAKIHLVVDGKAYAVDSRPSDALALALRVSARIFVEEEVIEKSRSIDISAKITEIDKLKDEKVKEFLENLNPEDFGKYKM